MQNKGRNPLGLGNWTGEVRPEKNKRVSRAALYPALSSPGKVAANGTEEVSALQSSRAGCQPRVSRVPWEQLLRAALVLGHTPLLIISLSTLLLPASTGGWVPHLEVSLLFLCILSVHSFWGSRLYLTFLGSLPASLDGPAASFSFLLYLSSYLPLTCCLFSEAACTPLGPRGGILIISVASVSSSLPPQHWNSMRMNTWTTSEHESGCPPA